MPDLNEMWTELAMYLQYAERRGFGAKWLRMTRGRTEKEARAAAGAAWAATLAAEDGAATNAEAKSLAAAWLAAAYAAEVAERSRHAIKEIREAIEHEAALRREETK